MTPQQLADESHRKQLEIKGCDWPYAGYVAGFKEGYNKDLLSLEKQRWKWSQQTFPEATSLSSLQHLKEEILEIEADIAKGKKEPEEFADALALLFDSAQRHGISIPFIFGAFATKLEKNKARNWSKNPDNSYSHIKP